MEKTITDLETNIEKLEKDDKVGKENKRQLDGYISVTVKLMEKGKRLEKQNMELQFKFKNLNKEHKKTSG